MVIGPIVFGRRRRRCLSTSRGSIRVPIDFPCLVLCPNRVSNRPIGTHADICDGDVVVDDVDVDDVSQSVGWGQITSSAGTIPHLAHDTHTQ